MNQDQEADNQVDNNNEQINNNYSVIDKLTPKDILELTLDIFPSFFYIIAIIAALNATPIFCDPGIPVIFRTLIIIYTCFILKGFFQILLIKYNKSYSLSSQISLITVQSLNYICYFISILLLFDIFSNKPSSCFITNTFSICVLFCLVFLGIVNIVRIIINFIMIAIFFPLMAFSFFDNPRQFYSHYGIDPEIVRTLPTTKAQSANCICCSICCNDIEVGQEIIVLRCPGHHAFHASCIKGWLLHKVSCPVCRSELIL